jgi:hypothetical protein
LPGQRVAVDAARQLDSLDDPPLSRQSIPGITRVPQHPFTRPSYSRAERDWDAVGFDFRVRGVRGIRSVVQVDGVEDLKEQGLGQVMVRSEGRDSGELVGRGSL